MRWGEGLLHLEDGCRVCKLQPAVSQIFFWEAHAACDVGNPGDVALLVLLYCAGC